MNREQALVTLIRAAATRDDDPDSDGDRSPIVRAVIAEAARKILPRGFSSTTTKHGS
jgi:hypothetical protein